MKQSIKQVVCSFSFFDIDAKKENEPKERNTLFPTGASNGIAIALGVILD